MSMTPGGLTKAIQIAAKIADDDAIKQSLIGSDGSVEVVHLILTKEEMEFCHQARKALGYASDGTGPR